MNDYYYEEKITGIVENVVFHNSANFFTVIEVNIKGEIVTAVGTLSELAPGEEVILTGSWAAHEVFGRQFRITSCERSLPDTTAKLYRYLASGAVKGIGPKTALKIIERFGDKSFDVLENEPEKLAVETVSPQSSSERIVVRTHGVEAEFPPGTDIGMLAAFVKALSHA